MPLVPLTELLADAVAGRYAVGYFEAWDGASLDAVLEAAEAERSPVILGFGFLLADPAGVDARHIETFAHLGRAAAERSTVPVSLLLNEVHTVEDAVHGVEAGFNAAMLCSSDVGDVLRLVRAAHDRGAAVEGELGTLPDATGAEIDASHATLTDPDEAAAFVEATSVDCLAVSFGNVHMLEGRSADVDLDRLEAVHRSVSVPLVVHGGTSFPRDAVDEAIARGVAKFNVGTALKRAFDDAGRPAVTEVVRDLMRVYGSSGRA
jgi:ketose-bisphosphate aldolase